MSAALTGLLAQYKSRIEQTEVPYIGIIDKAGEGQDAGTMCHTLAAPVEGALKNWSILPGPVVSPLIFGTQ